MVKRPKRTTHADRVLHYMKRKNRPLSAYEILEDLRSEGVTAATTVYRALEKLLDSGLIHRIESLNAWTVCCGSHGKETPVFEICDDCGSVTEHLEAAFAQSIATLSERTGFSPNHSVLEIHGRCDDCSLGVPTH